MDLELELRPGNRILVVNLWANIELGNWRGKPTRKHVTYRTWQPRADDGLALCLVDEGTLLPCSGAGKAQPNPIKF
jgi:hypothetical protein